MRYFLFRFVKFFLFFFVNLALSIFIASFFIEDFLSHTVSSYMWVILVYLFGYYRYRLMTRRMVTTNEFMIIFKANFLAIFIVFFVITVGKLSDDVSRLIILTHFLLNLLNPIWSYLIKKQALKFSFLRRPVFAICDDDGKVNIEKWFDAGNPFGYDVDVIINISNQSLIDVHKKVEELIMDSRFDSVIIDFDTQNIFELNDLIDHIQKNIHRVIILPKISKIPMINGELISSIHHKGMAFYVRNNLLSPLDRSFKGIFDFLLAIILIIVFSPILLFLYILVYISTKGKPLFSHLRIGKDGRKFKVYKFRTMYLNADEKLQSLLDNCEDSRKEWEAEFKLKNDPRITKLGNILRKTSLDELPQLINVIRGEMSLVGPRPIVEQEIEKYGEYFEYFTSVKPGITGLWQVSGRNDIDYDERVQLDVWYTKNWSIELDFQILIKTIIVVLDRKGSY